MTFARTVWFLSNIVRGTVIALSKPIITNSIPNKVLNGKRICNLNVNILITIWCLFKYLCKCIIIAILVGSKYYNNIKNDV